MTMTKTSHLFETYKRWNITFQKAFGTQIIDKNGKSYLDLMSGIGVVNLGHGHPRVTESVKKQVDLGWHGSNFFQYEEQEKVASQLTENSEGDLVFFCNSGAEANEAAIKLARKAKGKEKIITFKKSFHGRTFGSMAATGQPAIHEGYGAMLTGFEYVPYNDISALKEALDEETAAIMLEVVQGEGGVIPGEDGFLQKAEELAKQYGALLIVDEVQTGIGRTGKLFAYEHAGLHPDIITVAKGLGNGFPVGAIIGKQELGEFFTAGSHGTTFGGNPLAMVAAGAVLEEVNQSTFLDSVHQKGKAAVDYLNEELANVSNVQEIRGKGLMIGIECSFPVVDVIFKLQEKGVLVIAAGPHVIRLLPPLVIKESELLEGLNDIINVLKENG